MPDYPKFLPAIARSLSCSIVGVVCSGNAFLSVLAQHLLQQGHPPKMTPPTTKRDMSPISGWPLANGGKCALKPAAKKTVKKQSSKVDASSTKKQKRKGDKDGTSLSAAKKRKVKPESGSTRSSCAGTEDDSSDEEDARSMREYPQLPEVSLLLLLLSFRRFYIFTIVVHLFLWSFLRSICID